MQAGRSVRVVRGRQGREVTYTADKPKTDMGKDRTVIFTVGLPGGGKTTWSTELVREDPTWVRVCRDDFRWMLCGSDKVEGKVEGIITEAVNAAVDFALLAGKNVVVDSTNCNVYHLRADARRVVHSANVGFRYFPVDPDVAIERDSRRAHPAGADTIMRMHENLSKWADSFDFAQVMQKERRPQLTSTRASASGLPTAAIFDIDGTLALMGDRSPFDWKRVGVDSPNDPVVEKAIHHRDMGDRIGLRSGRDESCRAETEAWLDEHNIPWHELHMRPAGTYEKDSTVKRALYDQHVRDKYHVYVVYDDRPQVVEMWHKLGLFVFNCLQGQYRF